jgi:hypothetical protein
LGETDVKIVGVSAINDQEAFMSARADVFVPKPMKFDVLRPIIQEVINKKKTPWSKRYPAASSCNGGNNMLSSYVFEPVCIVVSV